MDKAFTTKIRRTQTNIFGVEIHYNEGKAMYYAYEGKVYGFEAYEKHSIELRRKIAKDITNNASSYGWWPMCEEDKKLFK